MAGETGDKEAGPGLTWGRLAGLAQVSTVLQYLWGLMKLLCDNLCDFDACFWYVTWEQRKYCHAAQNPDNVTDFTVMFLCVKSYACCEHW